MTILRNKKVNPVTTPVIKTKEFENRAQTKYNICMIFTEFKIEDKKQQTLKAPSLSTSDLFEKRNNEMPYNKDLEQLIKAVENSTTKDSVEIHRLSSNIENIKF